METWRTSGEELGRQECAHLQCLQFTQMCCSPRHRMIASMLMSMLMDGWMDDLLLQEAGLVGRLCELNHTYKPRASHPRQSPLGVYTFNFSVFNSFGGPAKHILLHLALHLLKHFQLNPSLLSVLCTSS